jgi:hypothetical protein
MSARLCALTYAVGLVEEIITVAQCILGLLIDRDSIRLDVLETMAFVCRPLAQLGERVDPRRVVSSAHVVPFQSLTDYQLRPSKHAPFVAPPCSALSLSRSVHSPSIFANIRSSCPRPGVSYKKSENVNAA